ncbi:hypothetical protein JZ751_012485 [Albula glossodonta]|uniref:Charged multivesicular body protein 3 n=1 Tax=Albula glossodonta TaxID=121402 RepID=A0A8T2NUY5_9TELE|nr:hypothetical protein JZ751_012485 [Albula glossodonta]
MGLFGKSHEKPPKELVNEWSLKIRKEMRVIDRQIRDIQREEEKVKRSIKDAARKGQRDVCVILAKEMIQSKKAVSKLYASKAQMNSVLLNMKNQLSLLRVAGAMQKSTEVMKAMQSLVKIPEIQATMRELSMEMAKAGMIEEMMEDTFESMEDEDMEEAAEAEVDKILFDITAGNAYVPWVKPPAKSPTPCQSQSLLLPQRSQRKRKRRKTSRRCSPGWPPCGAERHRSQPALIPPLYGHRSFHPHPPAAQSAQGSETASLQGPLPGLCAAPDHCTSHLFTSETFLNLLHRNLTQARLI